MKLACRVQVYQIDERIGRANVVRAHDKVVLGARDQAILLHTGNQRSVHDAAGNGGREREGREGGGAAYDCAVRQ